MKKIQTPRRRPCAVIPYTLADRLLASGQRLRANEAMVAATVALNYAAKWQRAKAVAR